jgi:hypothetical protein
MFFVVFRALTRIVRVVTLHESAGLTLCAASREKRGAEAPGQRTSACPVLMPRRPYSLLVIRISPWLDSVMRVCADGSTCALRRGLHEHTPILDAYAAGLHMHTADIHAHETVSTWSARQFPCRVCLFPRARRLLPCARTLFSRARWPFPRVRRPLPRARRPLPRARRPLPRVRRPFPRARRPFPTSATVVSMCETTVPHVRDGRFYVREDPSHTRAQPVPARAANVSWRAPTLLRPA